MFFLRRFAPKALKKPDKVWLGLRTLLTNRQVQTFFVSFPKTGRTWLRVLMGRALTRQYGVDEQRLLATYDLTKPLPCDTCDFTHDGPFNLPDYAVADKIRYHERLYRDRKVVFLVRDIRDTIVSFYFQEKTRDSIFEGDLDTFLRDPRLGIPKLVTFYTVWHRHRDRPRDFLLLSYEELHADVAAQFERTLRFIGAEDALAQVPEAVAYAEFGNMKRMEQQKHFADSRMQLGNEGDQESAKVRRGKVGGFRDYLNEDQLRYLHEYVAEHGDPACDWYFHPSADAP